MKGKILWVVMAAVLTTLASVTPSQAGTCQDACYAEAQACMRSCQGQGLGCRTICTDDYNVCLSSC
ncbi:MAG TPA: hypothetical protein VLB76_10500 [Thermoanaerobaculia bacterium]|jgi:hypothetical protein|nr:hypothetical protein [Thermoanaerobaculia bacterium]